MSEQEKDAKVAKASRYIIYAIYQSLYDVDLYVKLSEFLSDLYEEYGVEHNSEGFDTIEAFSLFAVRQFFRNGWADFIRDDFAEPFLKSNNRTTEVVGSDPELGSIHSKFLALNESSNDWLRTAIAQIGFSFTPDDVTDYENSLKQVKPDNGVTSAPTERPLKVDTDHEVWAPLPIDRADPEFKEALSASEAALREIEGSNGYAETELEERNGIVATIRGTISALKDGTPSKSSIVQGLLKPLQYISKKFADSTMGEIAKIAAAKLAAWLFS